MTLSIITALLFLLAAFSWEAFIAFAYGIKNSPYVKLTDPAHLPTFVFILLSAVSFMGHFWGW